MSGFWAITTPEQGTNKVLNPIAGATGNFAGHNSGTIARDSTYARFGVYAYKVTTGGTNRGINLTLSALENAAHYVTFYIRPVTTLAGTFQVSLDSGSNYNAASIVGGMTGGWVRYGVSIVAAQANTSTACIIRDTANENFYISAIQVEQTSGYFTTFICGDLPGLYKWTGLRHGSTSLRDSQERSGGRERDLEADYEITVRFTSSQMGMAPIRNNSQETALQPGSIYQGYKVLPRNVVLDFSVNRQSGASWATLHQKRQSLIDLIKPDATRGAQPFTLRYAGVTGENGVVSTVSQAVYGRFVYESGLEFYNVEKNSDRPQVRCTAFDPLWYEDNRESANLISLQNALSSANYAAMRYSGLWQVLGSGFNGAVYATAVDKERNRIYFAGAFSTANGVTVNGICYWNGTTFVALGSTAGVAGGSALVYTLALAPNGDVYIGGDFTSAGGSTADGLARWNVAAGTWTVFANGTPGDIIRTLVINSSGTVYGGGSFTNWDGIAAADYVFSYDGTNFSAVGTSPFGSSDNAPAHYSFALDSTGVLYAVTNGGNFYKWDGSAWTTIAAFSGGSSACYSIAISKSGYMYIGGDYTTVTPAGLSGISANRIALYTGQNFYPLGDGLSNNTCRGIAISYDGLVYAFGNFATAGGISLADSIAIWNGYAWAHVDVDLPGAPIVRTVSFSQGDIYIGFSTSGDGVCAYQNTLSNGGTTTAYPVITLIGPDSAYSVLQSIENQTTQERLFFNLRIYSGETITIDLRANQKVVTSAWRGVILDQPLDGSEFAAFHLQPGTNIIAAFLTGTLTNAVVQFAWDVAHWSVDGGA